MRMQILQPIDTQEEDKYSSKVSAVSSLHVSNSILKIDSISTHCG